MTVSCAFLQSEYKISKPSELNAMTNTGGVGFATPPVTIEIKIIPIITNEVGADRKCQFWDTDHKITTNF